MGLSVKLLNRQWSFYIWNFGSCSCYSSIIHISTFIWQCHSNQTVTAYILSHCHGNNPFSRWISKVLIVLPENYPIYCKILHLSFHHQYTTDLSWDSRSWQGALQILMLYTLFVVEVGYLLSALTLGAPKKEIWKWEAHLPPTLKLLNVPVWGQVKAKRKEEHHVIVAIFSVTRQHYLRQSFFFNQTIWMDQYSDVVKNDFNEVEMGGIEARNIMHYLLTRIEVYDMSILQRK